MTTWKNEWGPKIGISQWVYETKYFPKESYKSGICRVADALKDSDEHFKDLERIFGSQSFLPGGRILNAMGSGRNTTPMNCYVMDTIPDTMEGIMRVATEAALTMKQGGGVGYDFSTLRPRGAIIRTLDSQSSGPLSFMDVFDAVCATVSSAGHRRGAQMGVLAVDHPDIEEFIEKKTNHTKLLNFNISVAVTDEFMEAVKKDDRFDLKFEGQVYRTVQARALWDKIMRATWDWAEPGVLFIDRINRKNNLWFDEYIAATNPCGEQPLPPYGACLLGSFNLTKYLRPWKGGYAFEREMFQDDVPAIVRAMDNVIDRGNYPLEKQREVHKSNRRMGLGITGLANTAEILGAPYGSPTMLEFQEMVMRDLRDASYDASVELAQEKGPFPSFHTDLLQSEFAQTLHPETRDGIDIYGLRNSHLLSIAPTGTISLAANNISSGIEPVFSLEYERDVQTFDGTRTEKVEDYAYREYGVRGRTVDEVTIEDHVNVLNLASKYVDSACSKTCNVSDSITFEQFKEVYMSAYDGGASGCTTFRAAGQRFGMMRKTEEQVEETTDGGACYIDTETGVRTCEE